MGILDSNLSSKPPRQLNKIIGSVGLVVALPLWYLVAFPLGITYQESPGGMSPIIKIVWGIISVALFSFLLSLILFPGEETMSRMINIFFGVMGAIILFFCGIMLLVKVLTAVS